jgi:hypothetical protein
MLPTPQSIKLQWSKLYCERSPNITIASGEGMGSKFRYSGVLGTMKNPSRFKVRVKHRNGGVALVIGLAPRESFVDQAVSLQKAGYFIDVAAGRTIKCLNAEENDVQNYRNGKIRSGSVVEVRFDTGRRKSVSALTAPTTARLSHSPILMHSIPRWSFTALATVSKLFRIIVNRIQVHEI